MPKFLSSHLAELTRQLSFAPPPRRRQQLQRAEDLYWHIEPGRNYPLEFIVFRVTGFRPDTVEDTTLTGEAIRHDLLIFVEEVSDSLAEPVEAFTPPPVDLDTLRRRWNVTAKTISRYRRDGLFCRRAVIGGRKRIVFLAGSIERFLAARPQQVERAARFSRLDKETRKAIIRRARRIARRVDVSVYQVARHLGRKYKRPTETLRAFLLRHDKRRPEKAIFPDHQPPLSERQQRAIYKAFEHGASVADLARRFGRARNAVYRSINLRRAAALREFVIRFHVSPTFELDDAERVILGSPLPQVAPIAVLDPPPKQPALSAAAEAALFARYNYLKYRAAKLRDALDSYQPSSVRLDAIETYLRRAAVVKDLLIAANMRVVSSAARRQLAGTKSIDPAALLPLNHEGAAVLTENIELWDPAREGRVSTFMTYHLMRHFAQRDTELTPAAAPPASPPAADISALLEDLDETERLIVTRHLGLGGGSASREEPVSLADLAAQLKIPVARARRIERRAMAKLHLAGAPGPEP